MSQEFSPDQSGYVYFRNTSGIVRDAYFDLMQKTKASSALDPKTFELVYVAYLGAIKNYSGIEVHVKRAKEHGATREEVESVMLCGIGLIGATHTDAYKLAMTAYDD